MKRCTRCNLSFPSIAAYQSHESRVHTAQSPWQCEHASCGERFATRREMRAHARAHTRERAKSVDDSRSVEKTTTHETFERTFNSNENEPKRNASAAASAAASTTDSSNDIKEIASNCAYFSNQLRTARSSAITRWNEKDFQNAHRWALYVGEQMKNIDANGESSAALMSELKKKGINSRTMHAAEVLLFDSILGCDALKQNMLEPLCSSIFEMKKEKDTQSVADNSREALTESVYASMRRKAVLYSLHEACTTLNVTVDCTMTDAAAKVLLEAHNRIDNSENVVRHMKLLADASGGSELLVREAILARNGNIAESAVNTIIDAGKKNDQLFLEIPGNIMALGCQVSFKLFNHYIGYLLSESAISATDGNEEINERKCLVDERLRQLLVQRGNVGEVTQHLLDRYHRNQSVNSRVARH